MGIIRNVEVELQAKTRDLQDKAKVEQGKMREYACPTQTGLGFGHVRCSGHLSTLARLACLGPNQTLFA